MSSDNNSMDEFMDDVENNLEKALSDLRSELEEELLKSCPRCGQKSANAANPSGRCSSCLKKLATNKKKVGHYLHNHKIADDCLRREKGKNGTAHKKSKGLGNRKDIIDKTKRAEKKAGQVLSPDRKDNSKGYSSKNVRMVDPKLNRGRHTVDPKKLAKWRKSLKKMEIPDEDFYLLLLAKAAETQDDTDISRIYEALVNVLENDNPEE